jgi:hypothetical protein
MSHVAERGTACTRFGRNTRSTAASASSRSAMCTAGRSANSSAPDRAATQPPVRVTPPMTRDLVPWATAAPGGIRANRTVRRASRPAPIPATAYRPPRLRRPGRGGMISNRWAVTAADIRRAGSDLAEAPTGQGPAPVETRCEASGDALGTPPAPRKRKRPDLGRRRRTARATGACGAAVPAPDATPLVSTGSGTPRSAGRPTSGPARPRPAGTGPHPRSSPRRRWPPR